MILLIDNYDSFTYNLVQRIGELDATLDLRVVRNDKITAAEALALKPDHVIVSPGPCTPKEAGVSCDIIEAFTGKVPVLGVCLGHQSIGQSYGGNVIRAPRLMHGKTSPITHDGKTIYRGLPSPFEATRYHSLIVEEASLPDCLEVTARTPEGEIMGLRHRSAPVEGVQFHPESILTQQGYALVRNWLDSL
jgi:anthranilate synthase/aminodeoxychorismate synthase-like glutamine amidotransferase